MSILAKRNFRRNRGGQTKRAFAEMESRKERGDTPMHPAYSDDRYWMDVVQGYDVDAEYEMIARINQDIEKGRYE